MYTPKFKITPQNNPEEQRVQMVRGKRVVADVVVCLNRKEMDAFLLGCRLIEDILEKSKGEQ